MSLKSVKIKVLDISHNQIRRIPELFLASFLDLETLRAEHNRLGIKLNMPYTICSFFQYFINYALYLVQYNCFVKVFRKLIFCQYTYPCQKCTKNEIHF